GGKDQVAQKGRTSVLAGTGRGLDDHRGVGLVSRFHDRAHLLEVVDVEGRDAVAVLGSVVQHLAQADQSHDCILRLTELMNPWRSLPQQTMCCKCPGWPGTALAINCVAAGSLPLAIPCLRQTRGRRHRQWKYRKCARRRRTCRSPPGCRRHRRWKSLRCRQW